MGGADVVTIVLMVVAFLTCWASLFHWLGVRSQQALIDVYRKDAARWEARYFEAAQDARALLATGRLPQPDFGEDWDRYVMDNATEATIEAERDARHVAGRIELDD